MLTTQTFTKAKPYVAILVLTQMILLKFFFCLSLLYHPIGLLSHGKCNEYVITVSV
jgi:hypothetical protein